MSAKKSLKSRAKVAAQPKELKRQVQTNRDQDKAKSKTNSTVVDLTEEDLEDNVTIETNMDPLESDDYFVVLGLPRKATEADVKKAYRKLAVQWHPDKNRSNPRAEEFFKKIGEAYEVLGDPEKRELYEAYGKAGVEQGGSPNGADYSDHFGRSGFSAQHARDVFDAFFGGSDPFEAFFGGRQSRSQYRDFRGRFDSDDDWGQSPFESMGFGRRGFGMSTMSSFFSDGFGDMGGGSFSTSTSSSSSTFTDRNGHVVTQKTTTTVGADGRTETVTEEFRNGKLVNSTSSSSRLASAGRMQLEGNGGKSVSTNSQSYQHQRRGSSNSRTK